MSTKNEDRNRGGHTQSAPPDDSLLNFDDFFVTDDPASSQAKDYLNSKSSDSFILYVEAYDKSVQLGFNVDDTVDCLLTEYPAYKTAKHLYSSGKTEIGTVEVYLISK